MVKSGKIIENPCLSTRNACFVGWVDATSDAIFVATENQPRPIGDLPSSKTRPDASTRTKPFDIFCLRLRRCEDRSEGMLCFDILCLCLCLRRCEDQSEGMLCLDILCLCLCLRRCEDRSEGMLCLDILCLCLCLRRCEDRSEGMLCFDILCLCLCLPHWWGPVRRNAMSWYLVLVLMLASLVRTGQKECYVMISCACAYAYVATFCLRNP